MSMNYEEAMNYIEGIGKFGSKYGLERTLRLLELLGDPQKNIKIIHIAGTNGKGSTTAMVTKMLRGAGFKTGMYTSPYLEEFEERIQIDGKNIPKDKLTSLIEEVKTVIEKVAQEGYEYPTQFEIITAIMFLYFYREKVDYAVVEVGLGGRLDSTNVIIPEVSVITSISLDHMDLLGDTLEKIASEKSGIIKKGIPVVIYPQKEEAAEVIKNAARENNSLLRNVNINDVKLVGINYEEVYQEVEVNTINNVYRVKLPLLGEHQILNLAVALNTIEVLFEKNNIKIDTNSIENSLCDVKWIGRLEVLNKKPLVVIDGAHNIDGIRALRKNSELYFKYNKMYLILGILADKQVGEMIKEITPKAAKVFAVTPHSERAALCQDLKNEIVKFNENAEAFESYEEAFKSAFNGAKEDDLILVSGSLYMIGDMRKVINSFIKNK